EYDYLSNRFTALMAPGGVSELNGNSDGTEMLDLPDGTVLFTDSSANVYVYRPDGVALAAGKPSISALSTNLDGSYHLIGRGFNGISAGASQGDDKQNDSNFPIVRLTNSLGRVFYCRTYNWSSAGVMTGTNVVSTEFTLPDVLPVGTYGLVVVANG